MLTRRSSQADRVVAGVGVHDATARLGFGRIVGSDIEAPNMLVYLV
jgi:hypothetical protein